MKGSRKSSSEPQVTVFIGIGSNVGDPVRNCGEAARRIAQTEELEVLLTSSLYRTEPVGYKEQGWFVNGVVKCFTTLQPLALLSSLLRIEDEMGRERTRVIKWGPRIIDLDILFYGGLTLNLPELIIPHPLIEERRFVLAPMAEIEPKFVHPVSGRTIEELLAALPEGEEVERIHQ